MRNFKYVLMAVLLVLPYTFGHAQTKKVGKKSVTPVVEVLYFHGPQRCKTCVALQKAAKELVEAKFAKELKSGRVKFREIDLSSKEGEKLGDKYEITWSSLVVVRKQGKKEKVADLTDDGFRYAVNNKAKIQSILQRKITEFLK
jgi:hypothetical protein